MFQWDDCLALAERLAEPGADEAAKRSAIGRANDAAYHAASSFVRRHGLLRIMHSHRLVWGTLMVDRDVDRAWVGLKGNWLKDVRILADYRSPFPGDIDSQVQESIAEARELIEALRR